MGDLIWKVTYLKGPVGESGSKSFWTNFMLALIYVQSKVQSQMDFDFRSQIWVLWTKKKFESKNVRCDYIFEHNLMIFGYVDP